ncbi:MAG: thioredoxin domain-containing protein [Flavobacterium lindanitolerans]|uniref:thioredoxin domain-containing protein n=1 Tax=Flavobacterium lindanitolerans TaxID=428988 RepID=UPI001A46412A|nr:thioredoxin domain-containing protein [Flavobacterium lindanitolerans]MBL7866994.1 thioredoxin domain-containing protein [Flavobacterium lindanitolerans]
MNELQFETSPYLLQHANNPVHWKAWNPKSLELAKETNKLIIVSVGYSACHWCHVMEHETFEDTAAAAVMNRSFINIKVDREERPDIDAVYMKAVQIMTGRGGWPMNVVCLPDGRPVWGGTYFRKEEWMDTLEQLQQLYLSAPEKMLDYAEKLHQGINAISLVQQPDNNTNFDADNLKALVEKWKKSFDWEFGGYSRAPKFMMPSNYSFLLRYAYQEKDSELSEFVNLTLTRMAYGGLFDTVGGGFSRYSVDMKWHVPHFEKMLYDNGQLVSLYSEAYRLTHNPLYKKTIEKTLSFISKELTAPNGGFYSALDADSLTSQGHLEEGAYYVWNKQELRTIVGEDFELFAIVFNINDFGYWENGNYVLIQSESLETIAQRFNLEVIELQNKKENWEKSLYTSREKRKKPRLDDKCLTSWNALMLKGFVDAYKAIGNKSYLDIALKNADFIIENLWTSEGNLLHNHKNGKNTINGYLEDYCFVIEAFISLYETTLDGKWLQNSRQLTDYCFDHFYEPASGFFTFTSDIDTALITKHFELEDNVIVASNSAMANNLYKLGIYFENSYYEAVAQKMLNHILPNIDYPSAFSNWLHAFLNFSDSNKELAVCGENALENILLLQKEYLPNVVLAGTHKPSELPFLKARFEKGKDLFYLCQNKTCEQPLEDIISILNAIKS